MASAATAESGSLLTKVARHDERFFYARCAGRIPLLAALAASWASGADSTWGEPARGLDVTLAGRRDAVVARRD